MTLYAEPMLTTREVATALGLTPRGARFVIAAHPETTNDGMRLLIPARCLDELRERRRRGRPAKIERPAAGRTATGRE